MAHGLRVPADLPKDQGALSRTQIDSQLAVTGGPVGLTCFSGLRGCHTHGTQTYIQAKH